MISEDIQKNKENYCPGKISLSHLQSFCKNKSICLVGNAKSMLGNGRGEWIDSHDIVLRMNQGFPSEAHAKDIGLRMDIWACGLLTPHYPILSYVDQYDPKIITWLSAYSNKNMPLQMAEKTHTADMDFFIECGENLNGHRPSTGMLHVELFSRKIPFKKLSIYGFDFFRTPEFYRGHVVTAKHQPAIEREHFMQLIKKKNIEWTQSY